MKIDGVTVLVDGFEDMTEEEAAHYIAVARKNIGADETITELKISKADDGKVNLDFAVKPPTFVRIRRITGYLTSSVEKWNNAKRAEEKDRVKHGM